MSQPTLSELIYPKVEEYYGDTPPQEVSRRIAGELALIEAKSWEPDFLRAYEITQRLRAAGELWMLPGIDGGFSLSAFLLGITQIDPLPPHNYCPKCKRVTFSAEAEDGFDLPERTCPRCGATMRGDGHGIGLDDCLAYFANRRFYELFTEWHTSRRGRHLIGEYLSQCGPATPFFGIEFEEEPKYPIDPYGEINGNRVVNGWVLSPPEALPIAKWADVEYPEGSGQFVQAFFREDKLVCLPHTYIVHARQDAERLTLLCRKAGIKPEDIPCNEPHAFSSAVQKAAVGTDPGGSSAKASGITRTISSRRLEWFARNYPAEYSALELGMD